MDNCPICNSKLIKHNIGNTSITKCVNRCVKFELESNGFLNDIYKSNIKGHEFKFIGKVKIENSEYDDKYNQIILQENKIIEYFKNKFNEKTI